MTDQQDLYTTPSAPDLKKAARLRQREWSQAIAQMHWSTERFGFAIGETGRGGPLANYAVFTIGLIVRDQQEFVVLGLPPEAARLILFSLARQVVRHGRSFEVFPSSSCDPDEHRVVVDGKRPYDEEEDLVVRLRPLSLSTEDQLEPGGLYRHPWDENRRTPMIQVHVDQFPVLPTAG